MTDLRKYCILVLFSFIFIPIALSADFTVVIDAGHGGKDMGAIGLNVCEKDINLGVALKLGKLIERNFDDVSVVYTRNSDKFITLQDRADIANKAKGNLFISIHTNSVDKKSKNRTTVKGSATYTLGLHKTAENLAVAKRENSVIALENNYKTAYQGFDPNLTESYIIFEINQNKHVDQSIDFASKVQKELAEVANRTDNGVRQAGFWVLAKTSMPAVLVELDFICNPTQEAFLGSEDGQKVLARSIYNAFNRYKRANDAKIARANKSKLIGGKKKEKGGETTSVAVSAQSIEDVQSEPLVADSEYKYSTKKQSSRKRPDSGRKQKSAGNNNAVVERRPAKPNDGIESVVKAEKQNKSAMRKLASEQNAAVANSGEDVVTYKVQFLTSMKKLGEKSPEMKGLQPVSSYYDNGLYKYTFGETSDKSEASEILQKVKIKFKEAFVVPFKGGKRISY